MRYSLLLFDLDGTLTDPAIGITDSIQYALKKIGITVEDRTTLYPFIGPPLIDSFMKYFQLTREQAWQAVLDYREFFQVTGLYENEVYPGIPEMLQKLKAAGKTLIVASSKPEPYVRQIMEHFHLAEYFTYIAGSTMDETRQKKDEVIAYALEECGLTDVSSAIMVGDRGADVTGGKKLGTATAGVLFGYGSREELEAAGADSIAATVDELEQILMQ